MTDYPNCCSKNRNEWMAFGVNQPNRPARVKQSWLFFSCYGWQTLVAGFVFHKANYYLIPHKLYSAPDIFLPLHSLVGFCISKGRSSWPITSGITRSGCWATWLQLLAVNLQERKKRFLYIYTYTQDLHEGRKPSPYSPGERGLVLEVLACCVFLCARQR